MQLYRYKYDDIDMAFTKTDTADIEVSYDKAKFNFPHNRRGYRKFLQFISPTKVFRFDKEVRKTLLAGCIRDLSEYILYGNSIPVEYMLSAPYSFIIRLKHF